MRPDSESEADGAAPPEPRGELAVRSWAMPADTNPDGDIFGGWIMSLMDAAGATTATRLAEGRVATVAVSNISFLQPVKVGDVVCCYTEPLATGRSSIRLGVEVWVLRQGRGQRMKVTAAEFTFVALDEEGRPRLIDGVVPEAHADPEPPQARNKKRRPARPFSRTNRRSPGAGFY